MAIIRGDGVAHSRRLNRCSPEAQTAYAHFVATVPDDFGRFALNVYAMVASRLYPRRDDDRGIRKLVTLWRGYLAEFEAEGLITTWEEEGVRFGCLTGWSPTGNLYHRTPEPPGSDHVHNGRCIRTALRQARLYGLSMEAEKLTLRLRQLRERDPNGTDDGSRTGLCGEALTSSPSSPSSPSSCKATPAGVATLADASEPASTPADSSASDPAPRDLASAIPHDPDDGLHRQIVARCIAIAEREATSEGREATAEDVRSVFVAVSATPNGRSLDGLLDRRGRKSKRPWVEQTLVACDRFEADMGVTEPPEPWLRRAAQLWTDATGTHAPARLEDVLRELVQEQGWDSIERDWAVYCTRPCHELSPEHFVALRTPETPLAGKTKRIRVVHPQPDAEQAWAKVLSLLDPENPLAQPRPGLKAEAFRAWLRPLHGVRLEGKVVVALAPTESHATWAATNFAADLETACKEAGYAGYRLIVGALPAHLN